MHVRGQCRVLGAELAKPGREKDGSCAFFLSFSLTLPPLRFFSLSVLLLPFPSFLSYSDFALPYALKRRFVAILSFPLCWHHLCPFVCFSRKKKEKKHAGPIVFSCQSCQHSRCLECKTVKIILHFTSENAPLSILHPKVPTKKGGGGEGQKRKGIPRGGHLSPLFSFTLLLFWAVPDPFRVSHISITMKKEKRRRPTPSLPHTVQPSGESAGLRRW